MKRCRQCEEMKPISSFELVGKKWHRNVCRDCHWQRSNETRRQRNKEKTRSLVMQVIRRKW